VNNLLIDTTWQHTLLEGLSNNDIIA